MNITLTRFTSGLNTCFKKLGHSLDAMKQDKGLRNEMMELLRRNSALTLIEIGKLCGGYAESTVSVILRGRNVK